MSMHRQSLVLLLISVEIFRVAKFIKIGREAYLIHSRLENSTATGVSLGSSEQSNQSRNSILHRPTKGAEGSENTVPADEPQHLPGPLQSDTILQQ